MSGLRDDRTIVRGALHPKAATAHAALDRLALNSRRYEWLLPVLVGALGPVADARTRAIATALMNGFDGNAAVDRAMEIAP